MAIVTYKNLNGHVETWTCTEDKLEHILDVCEAKGLEVIDFEVLR